MGVFSGPITFRRFEVIGDLPEGFRDQFVDAISKRAHQEVDPNSEDERSWGWVCAGDILDTEFLHDKLLVGNYYLLQLRVDTLKVPAGALKIYLTRAENEFRQAMGRERLTKADKEDVKDRVVKALRKRVLPSIKGYDVAWNIQTGVVRLWTHDKTVGDLFQELFVDTFGLRLVPRTPFTVLEHLEVPEGAQDDILKLAPADLVGVTGR